MLLTLAIPTYNRAESLRARLHEFVAQIERVALTDVEIVVSDNCSTDSTPQVCADVAVAHPALRLRYFSNATNLGFASTVTCMKVTKRQASVCSTPLSLTATFALIGMPPTRGRSC